MSPDAINPSPQLLARSTGDMDAGNFWRVGAVVAGTMMYAVAQYAERNVDDILDWGCGPGRVSRYLAHQDGFRLAGCDIDAEAVQWCNDHIQAGAFTRTDPVPPLPYEAASFDAVIAVSVMTHLQRRWQLAWLTEIRRILRPGGVLAASVHGRLAAETSGVEHLAGHVENVGGIYDEIPAPSHNGIAPEGYYRDVYQTEAWTRDRWSVRLPVVVYEEAAVNGHQDLVVCRKP